MKLILVYALQLSTPDQQRLLIHLDKLPTDPDHLHHLLIKAQLFQKYISCPKCFALYDFMTLTPLDPRSSLMQSMVSRGLKVPFTDWFA